MCGTKFHSVFFFFVPCVLSCQIKLSFWVIFFCFFCWVLLCAVPQMYPSCYVAYQPPILLHFHSPFLLSCVSRLSCPVSFAAGLEKCHFGFLAYNDFHICIAMIRTRLKPVRKWESLTLIRCLSAWQHESQRTYKIWRLSSQYFFNMILCL